MLKIQRKANGRVLFALSGRIEAEDTDELGKLLELEKAGSYIALDLRDVTLVDSDGAKFLAVCEANGVQLENCRHTSVNGLGEKAGRQARRRQ
ncbi:MAG TPA: hypothetical protein VNO32_03235 [Candidatus Acidoferrum sp.]|jgi:hypothetical protein|nr:hypothetical protein [Candidatus Acidoferrum sp.]